MSPDLIILNVVVFAAALIQAAIGIGFGLLAGPVFLLVIGSTAAIQMSAALSLAIAILLVPSLRHQVDVPFLKRVCIGSCVGIPAGLYIYLTFDIAAIKLLAGIVVLAMLIPLSGFLPKNIQTGPPDTGQAQGVSAGILSGIMSACLAMPGPVPAAWLAYANYPKDVVRATILALFLFSYPVVLAVQSSLEGVNAEAWWNSLLLLPATIAGITSGKVLAKRINETLFRRIVMAILAGTGIGLLLDAGVWK